MSADAKLWQDESGCWCAIHDGPCDYVDHRGTEYELRTVIEDIETCMNRGHGLRWHIRVYPDGKTGLVGFEA